MLLHRLDITGVRNLKDIHLTNLAQVNIFSGFNGSGKTSVLESIHMLSLARSFRSHKLNPVINHEAQSCVVFGELNTDDAVTLPIGVQRSKKDVGQIKVSGKALRSVSALAEHLPLQVINSDTFRLLEGSPSVRRQYLDWGVFHVEHRFHETWKATQRCLKQRNSLLRHGKMERSELAIWNAELAKHGEQLSHYRSQYFQQLLPKIKQVLAELTDVASLQISYYRGWDKDKPLAAVLDENSQREIEQGRTLNSPHKADIRIRYHGSGASETLSRGQQKLVTCALRVAQGQLLAEKTQRKCIYLIDDLPAELDSQHRKALCSLLEAMGCQVFVTCVDHQDLLGCWSDEIKVNVFHVEHGTIKQAA
jgi:DNA replication and repair protein RecF